MLTIKTQDYFLDKFSEHLFRCPFKAHFGYDCPGCGLQRSLISLLKGNWIESMKLYPATLPLLFLLIFTLLHLRFRFSFGAKVIQQTFLGVALLMFIHYFYKIYTHQLIS